MWAFDHIIFSLQKFGGISEWWREHILQLSRLSPSSPIAHLGAYKDANSTGQELFKLCGISATQSKPYFWYWRGVDVPSEAKLFHSSYLRSPSRKDIPSIFTFHDSAGISAKTLRSHSKRLAVRRCAESASVIHCISKFAKTQFLECFPDMTNRRIEVIYHGIHSNDQIRIPSAVSNLTKPFVLWVGNRGGYKNGSIIWAAIRGLPDFHLILVGGESLTIDEKRLIKDLGIESQIIRLSAASREDLNGLYQKAACLWYPSLVEGFGFPPLEAARWECPVLAASGHAVQELCGDWGIFSSRPSPDWLVERTRFILQNNVRNDMKSVARSVRDSMGWNRYGAQMLDLYRDLLQ